MAASLRRRGAKNDAPDLTSSTQPDEGSRLDDHQQRSRKVDQSSENPQRSTHSNNRGKKRRNTFIFLLGSLFGLVAAGFFAKSSDLIDFPEIGDLSMDSFFDVLPAGLAKEMRDLVVSSIAPLSQPP